MKKILVLTVLAVALIATAGWAQAQKEKEYATQGVFEFGGSAGYSSGTGTLKDKGAKVAEGVVSTLSFRPEIDYFIVDNISLGGVVDLESITTERKPEEGESTKSTIATTTLYLAPKYVFKGVGVHPYIGLLVGILSLSKKTENGGTFTDTTSLTSYGLEGGIKAEVTEGGLLNAGVRYVIGSGKEKVENAVKYEYDITPANNFSLGVGFTLYR